MTQPQQQLNRIPMEPSLKDLLDTLRKDIFLNLNCHALATIQSFNSENVTVTASINYTKTYFVQDPITQAYVPNQVNYPLLIDCPAIIVGGGAAGLSAPIAQGDQCLILFNDRDIDNWFAGATSGPVASTRLHSLSDGIALVGLKRSITGYDPSRMVLYNGPTGVGVSSDKVKVYNASYTLNTILQNIMIQLETLANSVCVPGNPIAPTVATQLITLATELGTLLD